MAKIEARERAAQLLAECEAQLAKEYHIDDPIWKELTHDAQETIHKLEKELGQRIEAAGIPRECAPSLSLNWYGRGLNMMKEWRAEKRRVIVSRLDALMKEAATAIERRTLEGLDFARGRRARSSTPAKTFLDGMPKLEALMPPIDVKALPFKPDGRGRYHIDYEE